MLGLTYSNEAEILLDALCEALVRRTAGDALTPTYIVVPNRVMERYLSFGIAARLGIAANIRFHRLEEFIGAWIEGVHPKVRLLDRVALEGLVVDALHDDSLLAHPDLEPVRAFLDRDSTDRDGLGHSHDPVGHDLRLFDLAMRVAHHFEAYANSRPHMLAQWSQSPAALRDGESWQRTIWRHIHDRPPNPSLESEPSHEPQHHQRGHDQQRYYQHWAEAIDQVVRHELPAKFPREVYIFGFSYWAPVYHYAISALAKKNDVHIYAFNPCQEFWEDVNHAAFATASQEIGSSAQQEVGDADPLPLILWSRPGGDQVLQLNEATGADFDSRFSDPVEHASLLKRLQQDIVCRRRPRMSSVPDSSVAFAGCPSLHREVEWVADEIWRLVRASSSDDPLRFHEIAVFVPEMDYAVYLPHIASVFEEAHRIPYSIEFPLAEMSLVVDAALRLVELPLGLCARPDLVDVLTHPSICGAREDVDPVRWKELVHQLGVFHGLDHSDHADTYIDQDIFNWDQAIKRLVLGQFMTGERSGDDRLFRHQGHEYLVEEAPGNDAAKLALTIQSLLADIRFARHERLNLSAWAEFFASIFQAYVRPQDDRETRELRRCQHATQSLVERDVGGRPVSYRVASELLKQAIRSLRGARGESLAEGVFVSPYLPMRSVRFRAAFVLGLGEGRFPAVDPVDPLDLRTEKRQRGDLNHTERDRYTFLETLLNTRDALRLSWVARDPVTGDRLEPSSVVLQLKETLEDYIEDTQVLVRSVPLRRYDDSETALPEALQERRAAELGREFDGSGMARDEDIVSRIDPEHRPQVRDALKHISIPRESRSQDSRVVLSANTLRCFLECPLQGWARSVLGIERDDETHLLGVEDEPFETRPLDSTILLRDAFVECLRGSGSTRDLYQQRVLRAQSRGLWPAGPLAREQQEKDLKLIDQWRRMFDLVAHGTPERIRFGAGQGVGSADRVADSVELVIADPRPGRDGQRLELEITGRTEPLVDRARSSLILAAKSPQESRMRHQIERLRYALRGFVDHVLLSSSQAREAGPHRALVIYGGEPALEASTHFSSLEPPRAQAWLAAIASDLLSSHHTYFLPCEAMFRAMHRQPSVQSETLAEEIEKVRGQGGGSSRFGPVREAIIYPAPEPTAAAAIARRRFGLFFELSGLGR